jgi:hypothetical protein
MGLWARDRRLLALRARRVDAFAAFLLAVFGTGVAGLIFLGTCLVGRPLTFVLAVGWGLGLLVEATVRIPLIYLLPIDVMAGLSQVLQLVAYGLLIVWTIAYVRRQRRR